MPDTASAERAVIRVCRSGLEVDELQRQVLATLRRAISIDAAFFATADPETLLFTGALSEEPLAAMAPRFLDNELGGQDVNTFSGLVRSPGHVRSLDTATRAERMASARYRDIMRPVGLGDELRAALVTSGRCWGYLCLHREDGELGFTSGEAELVRRLAPHIAHALRQAILLHRPPADVPNRPGVVLRGAPAARTRRAKVLCGPCRQRGAGRTLGRPRERAAGVRSAVPRPARPERGQAGIRCRRSCRNVVRRLGRPRWPPLAGRRSGLRCRVR